VKYKETFWFAQGLAKYGVCMVGISNNFEFFGMPEVLFLSMFGCLRRFRWFFVDSCRGYYPSSQAPDT
jgi:hypothetical protein